MLHSVRARLTLWYTAILALVLIAFSSISYALLAREIRAATDASLRDAAREFAGAFSNDPLNAVPGPGVQLDFRYSDRDLMVLTSSGKVVAGSRSRMNETERRRLTGAVRHGLNGFRTIPAGADYEGIRIFALPINALGQRYVVVVSSSLSEQTERLESAAHALLFGIPVALAVAAGGGYLMARKSLAPVTMMSLKAREIGAQTLSERISVKNERDELGFLAVTLNGLLARLQQAFDSQRGFMADASHELRTPLSIIQGEADVALSRSDRSAAEYRESIEIMRKAALKLIRIVQNLFLLARTDGGPYPINKTRFYLDELLADCTRAMRAVATARRVELRCVTPPDLIIVGDEELIHRMMLNLLDNALKFTPSGGRIHIRATAEDAMYVIRVTDSGPGIPQEDQPHIFERFYRVECVPKELRGEARGSAGAGLGLPIARWIAEAHGGSVALERSDAFGSMFVVTLPMERSIKPVNQSLRLDEVEALAETGDAERA